MANVKLNVSIDETTESRFKELFEQSNMERSEFAELIVSSGLEAYQSGDVQEKPKFFDFYP